MKKYIALGIIATLLVITAGAVTISLSSGSDTQSGIRVRVSDVASDGVVVLIRFELKYENGEAFAPGETVDFSGFTLTDDKGGVLRENIGSNERYNGIRCKNTAEEPVDTLTGSFTVFSSEIADADDFTLSMEGMVSYIDTYKTVGFSLTDYLAQQPELNDQQPVYTALSSTDTGTIYDEPHMDEKGLAIRFGDDTNFEIDNLCLRDGFLFIRINSDEETCTTAQANLNIVAGGQSLYPSQDGTYGDKNFFCRLYRVTDEMIAGGITVESMGYRSIQHRAEGPWSIGFSLSVAGQETPTLITGMPGTIKSYGQELRLSQLAFTSYSIRISMEEVLRYQDVNEWGSSLQFYQKDGNQISLSNMLPMNEPAYSYDYYCIFDKNYSPENLGAIVIYNAIRYQKGTYYILYDFNVEAGTCRLKAIELGEDYGRSFTQMRDLIISFYTGSTPSEPVSSSEPEASPETIPSTEPMTSSDSIASSEPVTPSEP